METQKLTTLKTDNIDYISINNILWNGIRSDWNPSQEFLLYINDLHQFDFDICNSHKHIYKFLKKYLEENHSCQNHYFVDDFSYAIKGKDGLNYKSDETIKKDCNSLKIINKNKINK
jgi:hypothetical protein